MHGPLLYSEALFWKPGAQLLLPPVLPATQDPSYLGFFMVPKSDSVSSHNPEQQALFAWQSSPIAPQLLLFTQLPLLHEYPVPQVWNRLPLVPQLS
jgi:hypothetical protein